MPEIALGPRFLQILDVPGVKNIEAAVGEGDALTEASARLDFRAQRFAAHDLAGGRRGAAKQVAKNFIARHGGDANLLDFQSASHIR